MVFVCFTNVLTVKCTCAFVETPHKNQEHIGLCTTLILSIKIESWKELLQIGRFDIDFGGKTSVNIQLYMQAEIQKRSHGKTASNPKIILYGSNYSSLN